MGIPAMKKFVEEFEQHLNTFFNRNMCNLLRYFKLKKTKDFLDLEELLQMINNITELDRSIGVNLLLDKNISFDDLSQKNISLISEMPFVNRIKSLVIHSKELKRELLLFVRRKCLNFDEKIGIHLYKQLFRCCKYRIVKIFTTNYDNIIENSCNDLSINYSNGFEGNEEYSKWTGNFAPKKKGSDGLFVQLYKLHGSVTWYIEKQKNNVFKFTPTDIGDSKNVDQMMIYPTQLKQINNFPYNLIHFEFEKALEESTGCISIGHSFRDDYIKNWLAYCLKKGNFHLDIVDPRASIYKKEFFENSENVYAISIGFKEWIENTVR